jgi:hypothetical protein
MPLKTRDIVDRALVGPDPLINQYPVDQTSKEGSPVETQELPLPGSRTRPLHPAVAL